jgi:acyl-CoA thioester hydrolase
MGIELDGTGQGPVIITASSTFLLPVTYPDTLTVDCFALQPGRSSFMTYYHLYSEALNKQRVCEGEAKVVWIDTRTNASVPLPGAIREMVESSQLN